MTEILHLLASLPFLLILLALFLVLGPGFVVHVWHWNRRRRSWSAPRASSRQSRPTP